MKKVISIIAVLIITIMLGAGCAEKADKYTEEEHIARITQRLKQEIPTWAELNDGNYDSYAVYPLYDENEELIAFLLEIEPYGFTLISYGDEPSFKLLLSCYGTSTSMYRVSNKIYGCGNKMWSPYIADETWSQPSPDNNKIFILDENGERVYHKKSPYYVTGNIDERKYLIETEGAQYICAVKKDGEFINLISCEAFTVVNVSKYDLSQIQATLYFPFLPYSVYDL